MLLRPVAIWPDTARHGNRKARKARLSTVRLPWDTHPAALPGRILGCRRVPLLALPRKLQSSMIHVIAIITSKPGRREKVLEAFRANMPAVHAEQGCIAYAPAVDCAGVLPFQTDFGPDTFVVIEIWESAAALQAHAVAPHMLAYAARVRDDIDSRVIHVLQPV